MCMEKVRLTKLSEPVRSFLARVKKGKGLLVEDEKGREVARVLPVTERDTDAYVDATPAEREEAWQDIRKLQRKVGKSLKAQGVTEEDVVREILKDD